MKKLLIIILVIFSASANSFAYNYSDGVTTSGPTDITKTININGAAEISFFCYWYQGWGSCTILNNQTNQLIDSFTTTNQAQYSSVHTGIFYTVTLHYIAYGNVTGGAGLRW